MNTSKPRAQAVAALVLAGLLAGGWALFGTGIRVRWLTARGAPPAKADASTRAVEEIRAMGDAARISSTALVEASALARGAPPAKADASTRAVEEIRAMGDAARPALLSVLHGDSARARKSWVAGLLLRAPYYARAEVEQALASPDRSTARAAAFALMDGETAAVNFEESASRVEMGPWTGGSSRAPLEGWDPTPAIPVLVEWLGEREDLEARYAARLLGRIPPGDPRVKEALLQCVEEVPSLTAPGASRALQLRKSVVVDCLQSLLAWSRDHEDVPARVSKVVAWIEKEDRSADQWDLESYALRLLELARGRGVDPELLEIVARSKSFVVRQTLANVLEAIRWDGTRKILKELLRDETYQVRRAAVLTLRKRQDPALLDLAPWIVEDSMIYVRADALRSLGELTGAAPERCKHALPLLVACLEDPWPGPDVEPGSPMAPYMASAKAEVVEGCAISLYRIARAAPGFGEDGINDAKKRSEISQRLASNPEERRKAVEEWRKTVADRPEKERIPSLAARLEDRDPANVVRAAKELQRLTQDGTGFPKEVLERSADETAARNAVREARKKGEWEKTVEYWKRKAAM